MKVMKFGGTSVGKPERMISRISLVHVMMSDRIELTENFFNLRVQLIANGENVF